MTTPRVACICLVCGTLAVTSGCALPMRAWYDGLQTGARNHCDQQPPGAREDCQARVNTTSYDAYEKERSAPR